MHVDEKDGLPARTRYRLIDRAGNRAAWVELQPLTGRTHQLRAHMAAIGHPIVGDAKYGGAEAFLTGGISRKMHLHARRLKIDGPDGKAIDQTAELPDHFAETLATLGFEQLAGDMLPLDNPDPAKSLETKLKRVAAAAKTARKARKGERSRGERADARAAAQGEWRQGRPRAPAGRRRRQPPRGTARASRRARPKRRPSAPAAKRPASARREEMTRLAIFDCDGTLVDSGATIHRALGTAFGGARPRLPAASVTRKVIGLSLDEAMAALVPDADHAALSRDLQGRLLRDARRGRGRGAALRRDRRPARRARGATAGCSASPPARATAGCATASPRMASPNASSPSRPPTATRPSRTRRWRWRRWPKPGAAPATPSSSATPAGTWAARAPPDAARSGSAGAIMTMTR